MAAAKKTIFVTLAFSLAIIAGTYFALSMSDADTKSTYRLIQNAAAADGAPRLTGQATFEDAVDTIDGEITVWQGTIFGSDTVDLNIESITFTNTSTATDAEIESYSLYKNGSSSSVSSTTTVDAAGGATITPALKITAGENLELILTAQLVDNAAKGKTIILNAEVTTSVIKEEPTPTPTPESGVLTITTDNTKVDTMVIPAGLTDVPVGVFAFDATNEDMNIEDLTIVINEVDTTGSYTANLNQPDTTNDADSIENVSLFYFNDGTAVKKTSGQDAVANTIDQENIALLQDLDLIIEDNIQTLIEVRTDLREMDDQDSQATAQSGHAFSVALNLDSVKSQIRGIDSGAILQDDNITVEDEINETTFSSDSVYVFNNQVIAEASASQPSGTLTSGTNRDLLKFDMDFSGDTSDEPFLNQVVVDITGFGGACISADSDCATDDGVVYLYNGDNELIASTANSGGNEFVLDVGTDEAAIGGLSSDIVTDAGVLDLSADPIAVNGETYTIRADVYSDGADETITTSITINADAPGTDGIIWIDGGSNGTDGLAVQWIDLGAGSSETTIENTLSN